ncbi:hypothetical protein BZA77DRAFT_242155 [Pyronema omphalodes]|nr:hypothetical protein BZA77DRAFT_242155 [Pyronema omphalodes]
MVILDTAKDWRLKGNPLSQDSPHLRFYAGAPIVTFEGHTIGVFAVFDTQPRSVFPQASRRNLMDFARLAMTEFEMVMEEKASSSASKPSTISTTEASSTLKAPTKDDDSASIISRRGALSKKILKGIEENAEKMPPISPFLQDEPAPISRPQTKSTIAADSPTVPQEDHYPPNQLIYPDDRSSAYSTSSSFALPPPEFPPRTSSRNPPPPPLCGSPSSRYSDLETSPHSTPMPRYKQFRPNPIFTPRAPSPKSILSAPQSPDVITSMVEATYATSLIARSLDYDFVYLLRVTSTMQSRTSLSLNNQQVSIATKVLVAHGLPDPPPVFDAQLHLRALRSVGGLIFQNPTSSTGSMGLGNSHGILLPLMRDTTNEEECMGGIVLAAFAKKVNEPKIRADEVRFLREFGEAMKDILVKADRLKRSGLTGVLGGGFERV